VTTNRLLSAVLALVATVVSLLEPRLSMGTTVADEIARSARPPVTLEVLQSRITTLEKRIRVYEQIGARLGRWYKCIELLPVDQVGDVQHRWGFEYDERDGTGVDTTTALARHEGSTRPDLALLRLERTRPCLSRAPDPNGTGDDARPTLASAPGAARPGAGQPTAKQKKKLKALERRFEKLDQRIGRVERIFDRFDEWESCLSWLPVTEYGHEDQNLGYLYDQTLSSEPEPDRRVGAIDIDGSEWDDPDYMLLAFLGRDRPFTSVECGHEPGEGVDRALPRSSKPQTYQDRLDDLRKDIGGAAEDIEDLLEPVQEFVQFDECMFTVGVQDRGSGVHGFRYRRQNGTLTYHSALSFDMRGLKLPEMDVMAFPGEEPPSIECNEDAGGASTDE
jgi:hypothetical protein